MKAYNVSDKNCDGYSYIIYAESRGKAISTALQHTDGAFDDYTYTELWAKRCPSMDGYYYGRNVLDWSDPEDRGAMVINAGFYCAYEYDPGPGECEECSGKHHCERYEREHEDDEEC